MQQLKKSLCRPKQLVFDPKMWCKKLGNTCEVCHDRLTHEKSISLCNCYYFCHQNCFIQSYEPQLLDQYSEIKCKNCKQVLKVSLDATYKYQPSFSIFQISAAAVTLVFLILDSVGLALTYNSQLPDDWLFFFLYIEGLALSLLIYIEAKYVRGMLYTKKVVIKELLTHKLDIQTSAFKELDIYTNQELTSNYLVLQSKNQHRI